jgi:hypothetical protein
MGNNSLRIKADSGGGLDHLQFDSVTDINLNAPNSAVTGNLDVQGSATFRVATFLTPIPMSMVEQPTPVNTPTTVPTATPLVDLVASNSVTSGSGGIGTSGYLWTTLGLIGDISAGDRPVTAEKGPEDFRAEEGNNRFYFIKAVNLVSYPGSYAGVWGYSGEENGVYSYQICSTYADNLLRYRAVSQTSVTTWGPWRVVAMSDSPITFSDLTVSGGATFTTAVATQVTCDSVSSNYYISGGVTGITGSVTTLAPGGTTIISAYQGGLFVGVTPVP